MNLICWGKNKDSDKENTVGIEKDNQNNERKEQEKNTGQGSVDQGFKQER